MIENIIIIGGGPAGLSAAIYTARAGLSPLVFAGSPPGGQLTLTSEVENYPGFESILGSELIEKMRNHAKKFGARIIDENVMKVDFSKKPLEIYLMAESGKSKVDLENRNLKIERQASNFHPQNQPSTIYPLSSKSIIITTGAKALWLGLESETRLRGKGVSACATCDGFFFKNKVVGVVGGGDTALEEALTLTKFASKVYIIHRRDEFRASKIMQDRVITHPKIEIIWNAKIIEIMGENRVEGIKLKHDISSVIPSEVEGSEKKISRLTSFARNDKNILKLDGLFIAIGHKPDTGLFTGQIELDSKGYIITTQRSGLEYLRVESRKSKVDLENRSLKIERQTSTFQHQNLSSTFYPLSSKFNLDFQSATSVPGVFAAGDCVDHLYRQAGTASGMGIAAALEVEKYLEKTK